MLAALCAPYPVSSFTVTGLTHNRSVALQRSRVILDTNVVSAPYSLATSGFNVQNLQHRRGLHLLFLLQQNPPTILDTHLDQLEGSSFHRGGVDSYNLLRRSAAVRGLFAMSQEELTRFAVSKEPIEAIVHVEASRQLAEAVKVTESLLPWLYLPGYAVALLLRKYRGADEEDTVAALLSFARELPALPDVPSLAALLALYGNPAVRQNLIDGLFKLQKSNVAGTASSAAWDLAMLEYALLMEQDDDLQLRSVLVTEDGPLCTFVSCITSAQDAGGWRLSLSPEAFSTHQDYQSYKTLRVRLLQAAYGENEALSAGPTGDALEDACRKVVQTLERSFGLTSAPHAVANEVVNIAADWQWQRLLLGIILGDWHTILEFVGKEAPTRDVLCGSLHWCMLLPHENAAARQRSTLESLAAVLSEATESTGLRPLGEQLIIQAHAQEDPPVYLTALLQMIAIQDGLLGPAVAVILKVVRGLLTDIADARGVPPEVICSVLLANLDEAGLGL